MYYGATMVHEKKEFAVESTSDKRGLNRVCTGSSLSHTRLLFM